MFVKEWLFGIGFYPSEELFAAIGEDSEMAYYSKIDKHIRYSLENYSYYGITLEDNQFILDKVREYINKKNEDE